MSKRVSLGKGLGALMGENYNSERSTNNTTNEINLTKEILLEDIEVNPFQPRVEFEDDKLYELSQSILEHGLIQPITVKELENGKYQIISGERRFRASKIAKIKSIPAYIKDASAEGSLEMAIIENTLREDLNAIEIALGYQRLIDEYNLSHDELSQKVSQNRSTVTNLLRLLKLPPSIQIGIRNKEISSGHARALLSIEVPEKQIEVYDKIVKDKLNVRQVEDIVRRINEGKKDEDIYTGKSKVLRKVETHRYLSKELDTLVQIKLNSKGGGVLTIKFENQDKLKDIVNKFSE